VAHWCSLVWIPSTRCSASSRSGHGASVFTGVLLACQFHHCELAGSLRHVAGFPVLGLLRTLRPATRPSADGMPSRCRPGWPAGRGAWGRFPRSPSTGRRGWCPTLPLQPRHGYAAGFHRGLVETAPLSHQESPTVASRRACTAVRPTSTRFEPAHFLLRGFHRWFLHSYTVPSCLPDPTRLVVPSRPGVVRAAPARPGASRVRLPSASTTCCDRPRVGPFIPPGCMAPRGARGRSRRP